jgi:hypothetical protein
MRELADGLDGVAGAEARVVEGEVPEVVLELQPAARVGALELMHRLETGTPAIFADPFAVHDGRIRFGPMSLRDGEPARIAGRIRAILGPGAAGARP